MPHACVDADATVYIPDELFDSGPPPEEFYYQPDGWPQPGLRLVGPGASSVVDIDSEA